MLLILTVVPALAGVGKDVNLTHTKLVQPKNTVDKVLHALIDGQFLES